MKKMFEQKYLSPKAQFWWGYFGGVTIVAYRFYAYANSLSASTPILGFKDILLAGFWISFPISSGFLSRALEPHHRIIAVYEGASAQALFIVIAHALPL